MPNYIIFCIFPQPFCKNPAIQNPMIFHVIDLRKEKKLCVSFSSGAGVVVGGWGWLGPL